jgi:hypothetical protein
MWLKTALILFIPGLVISSCSVKTPSPTETVVDSALTQSAGQTTTAMMAEVQREFAAGQTATAAVEEAVEEALTTAVAVAVAQTLTAAILEPSDTPLLTETRLPPNTPTNTATPLPTATLTSKPALTQPPLPTVTELQACYQVIDPWCTTHQGCSTVDVRNQSGLNSSWHIWSDKIAVNTTFTIPAGPCILVTRPGRYNFHITYCDGEVADFSWQLNDNWWYKIPPCD